MKKISLFKPLAYLCILILLHACEDMSITPVQDNSKENHQTIRATWGDFPETKTAIQDDGVSVWWTTRESINVFHQGKTGKFTSINAESAATAVFDGTFDTETGVGDTLASDYWAIYPYSDDNGFDGTDLTIKVPNIQYPSEGSFEDKSFPAIAHSTSGDLVFYNVCGGICFTVLSNNVSSVVFKSVNGESLTGKVRVGFDDNGVPIVKELINGSDELTVGGPFTPGKPYYAIALPNVLSKGISASVYYNYYPYQQYTMYTIDKPLTISRSRFGKIETIDGKTLDGLAHAIKGIQKSLVKQYYSRQNIGGYPSFQIAMDCLGEDLVFPATGSGWWTNTGEVKWTANRDPNSYITFYPYMLSYDWISQSNRILDIVDEIEGEALYKDMIKAQALFFRANFYFWLVQLYAERYDHAITNSQSAPPLVLTAKNIQQPLSTVEETYSQIIRDLESAIDMLSDVSNPYLNYSSKSDITLATACGVRARVALAMQDWEAAKRYADAAISASSARLMTQEQYQEGFNDASNPEWMWGFEMAADETLYYYGYMAYMSWNFSSVNIRSCPKCINSKLYDLIPETDVRKGLFDPTGAAWEMPLSSYQRYPYMNRKFAVKDYSSSVADANFMRLGEMYLIAAEAAANMGNDAAAQQYLFDLNTTRDDSYVKSTKTGADLLEEIYTYRRIEFWGEGHRFLDLKRLNRDLDRTGANHDPDVSVTMQVPAGDIRWTFAIPQEAIDANSLIPEGIND